MFIILISSVYPTFVVINFRGYDYLTFYQHRSEIFALLFPLIPGTHLCAA